MYHSLDRLTTPLFPELFPFGGTLRADNDWVKLAGLVPWAELEAVYRRYFCPDRGRPAKECQLICGLLIAKHRESVSDRRVVKLLAENPYVQFFCGFDQFVTEEKIIHPSLLSKMRKRLGREFFALFEGEVLRVLMAHDLIRAKEQLVDATVVPANISYPTDCKLLNEAREWLMALALRFEGLLKQGAASDYADLARLGLVSRTRVTQIMNLLHLAPDIQEEILFLPRTIAGREPISERHVRSITTVLNWDIQRRMWKKIKERLN